MPKGIKSNLSDEDIQRIVMLQKQGLLYREIAEQFGLSRQLIGSILRDNGVVSKYSNITKAERELIVANYLVNHNQKAIADQYHFDIHNVRRVLHDAGIKTNNTYCHQKYYINEKYFDNIDTPNKAYLLGLLFADGNMTKRGNTWRISLQAQDRYILDSFCKELETDRPLYFQEYSKKKTGTSRSVCSYCF